MTEKPGSEKTEEGVRIVYREASLLRRLVYLFLLLFLLTGVVLGGLAIYGVVGVSRTARSVTAPVRELVQQLAAEATPVILPDPTTIVREVRRLARLETASYSMQKVIRAERNQDLLWGALGESLIFVAVGDVVAGIDLAQLTEADLQVLDPETVVLHLPDAELFFAALDNEQSYVADRDRGLLARVDPQLESQVRREAERQIRDEALEAGLLEEANRNARLAIEEFLNKLGFTNVIFTDEPPPPASPFEQTVPKGTILVTPGP